MIGSGGTGVATSLIPVSIPGRSRRSMGDKPAGSASHPRVRHRFNSAYSPFRAKYLYDRLRRYILCMPGLVQQTAEAIDGLSRSVWDDSSQLEKAIVAVVLIVTGLAIPVVPIVLVARYVANR